MKFQLLIGYLHQSGSIQSSCQHCPVARVNFLTLLTNFIACRYHVFFLSNFCGTACAVMALQDVCSTQSVASSTRPSRQVYHWKSLQYAKRSGMACIGTVERK